MGYSTNYSLKVERKSLAEYDKDKIEKIKAEIQTIKDVDVKNILQESLYNLQNNVYMDPEEKVSKLIFKNDYNPFYDACKWYQHEEDMRTISKKYPESLFVLKGEGEDGEMWIKYFLNGKYQYANSTVIFEEFDESKLS